MSQTLKNILVFTLFFILVLAGYYLYANRDSNTLLPNMTEGSTDDLLAKTEIFISRRADLESRTMDVSLFKNERFISLRSYRTEVPTQAVGRSNVFDTPAPVPVTRTPVIE